MKIVSLAIVIIFGGLLLVHYYRQYYNYTSVTTSITWLCEVDELGKCVEEIKLNRCPDYWQLSSADSKKKNSQECNNVYKICPADNPNCRSDKKYNDLPLTDGDSQSPSTKCNWSDRTKFSWDGACTRATP